jgi:cell division protein FtsQ
MSPVAVSADRRFHRAHVKPSRRRGAWRAAAIAASKYGIALIVLLLLVVRAATFISTSPRLKVDHINTSGKVRVSSDAVRSMLGGLQGENILFADLDHWRDVLLKSPWVRDVSFRRSLPSTVDVQVHERTPIAIGRLGNKLYLVDEHGASIDEFGPQYPGLDLPIVDGLAAGHGAAMDEERAALAARVIVAIRQKPSVADKLSQVDVTDVHDATVLLTDDPAQLRVGDTRFLERLESYLSLSAALHQRVPNIDYADLRFDGRVYVKPAGKTEKISAPVGATPKLSRVADAQRR